MATTLLALLAGTQSETIPPWWKWQHDGDTPRWQGAPRRSQLIEPLLTSPILFAAPGQAPSKFWRYDYDVRTDSSLWNWAAPPSWPIRLLTDTKFYSALGQAPTKFWQRFRADLNEERYWQFKPPYNLALVASYQFPEEQNRRYSPPNDPGVWQWQAPTNLQLFGQTVVQSPLVESARQFNYNDASGWQFAPPFNLNIHGPRPFFSGQSEFNYIEPPSWQWQLPPNAALARQRPIFSGQWTWEYDAAFTWQQLSVRNKPLFEATPFVSTAWHYDYDNAAFWLGVPSSTGLSLLNSLVITNPFFSRAWHTNDYDEPGSWEWYQQNIQNILSTSVTPPEPTPSPIQSIGGGVWRQGIHPSRRAKKRKRKHDQLELAEIAEAIAECLPLLPAQEAKQYEGIVSLARLAPVNVEAAIEEAKAALAAIERRIAAEEEDEMVAMLLLGF